MKKFLIWDEYVDIEDEGWKEVIEEEEAERGKKMSDNEKYDLVHEINDIDYEDAQHILNIQLDNPILIVADLGLWNGRRNGYKIIDSGNIKDILMCQMDGICKWYCDGENICCEEAHHDGTNYYTYREILSGTSPDEAIEAILYECKDYNLFTKSIAPYVSEVYGL